MAFPSVNHQGLEALITDTQLAVQFETQAAANMATIQDPNASIVDKQAAYNFFNDAVNGQGEYAPLSGDGLQTAGSGFMQNVKAVLQTQNNIEIPTPGGEAQVYKNDGSGDPATLWDFVSNPSASYVFRFRGGNGDGNDGSTDGNNWWGTSGLVYGRNGETSGYDTQVTTDGNGAKFPDGSSITVHTDGAKCAGEFSYSCYANAAAIEKYTTVGSN